MIWNPDLGSFKILYGLFRLQINDTLFFSITTYRCIASIETSSGTVNRGDQKKKDLQRKDRSFHGKMDQTNLIVFYLMLSEEASYHNNITDYLICL